VLDRLQLVGNTWTINVCFDSAWCPPGELYRYINEKYPDVEISATWEEPGMGQQGTYYFYQDIEDSTIEDYVDEEPDEEFDLPVTQATPNVGAATVLPLPGGNKK
jgi:hypothetical protein